MLAVHLLEHVGLFHFIQGNELELPFFIKRVVNVTLRSGVLDEVQHSVVFSLVVEFQSRLLYDWLEVLYVDVVGLLQANNCLGPLNFVECLLHGTPRELVFLLHFAELIEDNLFQFHLLVIFECIQVFSQDVDEFLALVVLHLDALTLFLMQLKFVIMDNGILLALDIGRRTIVETYRALWQQPLELALIQSWKQVLHCFVHRQGHLHNQN